MVCSQPWTEQPYIDERLQTEWYEGRSERATGMAEIARWPGHQCWGFAEPSVSVCVGLHRPAFPPLIRRNLFSSPPAIFSSRFAASILSHDVPLTIAQRKLDLIGSHTLNPSSSLSRAGSTARHLLSFTKRPMVSPTPTTAHPPVLSYAESAKKAQGVRHPSQPTQKPLSNPPRQPPAPPPELKKPPKHTSSVDVAQISLADLSLSDASAPSAPGANVQSHTSTSDSPTHDSSSREVALQGTPSAGSVPPLSHTHPPLVKAAPAPAPVPNVWNQRIQQRAQARSQPRPSQPHPQTPSSHVPRATSPPRESSIVSSGSRQPDPVGPASVQSTQSPSSSSLNGTSSSTPGSSTGTTPSSRKEPLLSPQRSSLVADVESWPEVGKCHLPTSKPQRVVGNGHVAVAEEKDTEEKNAGTPSSSHPGTPRKSTFFFLRVHLFRSTSFSLWFRRFYACFR